MGSTCAYDVIVVGAGLAGLQAAVDIQKAGLTCFVLEANDRIGGKVLSAPNLPESEVTVDLGAAWINDTSQSRIYALSRKYGAKFQKQFDTGDTLYELPTGGLIRIPFGDFPGSPEQLMEIGRLITVIDETGEIVRDENLVGPVSKEIDQLSFQQWIYQNSSDPEFVTPLLNFLCRAIVGADAADFSALYILNYIAAATGFMNIAGAGKDGGQYLRPYQGSKIYVHGLATELKEHSIMACSPVSAITQYDDYCEVHCATTGMTFEASKVIVSIPTPLYKHITFKPALPPSKLIIAQSTKLGYYSKLVLVYKKPWWRAAGLSGDLRMANGPIVFSFDTSINAQEQYSMTLFIVGPPGEEWSRLPSVDERRRVALDHVNRMYGQFVDSVPEPVNTIEQDWSKQPWFEGAPSSLYPPGILSIGGEKSIQQPVGHIHFAGTETSDVWEGYMEGAVRSGERAAKEIVDALKKY